MSATLHTLLAPRPGEALAVVGCGGKTSLINRLAQDCRAQKVLVLPTAKILPPQGDEVRLITGREACLAHVPRPGITCMGEPDAATGKLAPLPAEDWQPLAARHDLTLMEADGSRGLPCKGWREDEPVVPPFATRTIGVVTTWALGRPANEKIVLRLPLFLGLTGLKEGDAITLEALATMVGHPDGMFRRRAGRSVLIINQVGETGTLEDAQMLAHTIKKRYALPIHQVLAGSVRQNAWLEL